MAYSEFLNPLNERLLLQVPTNTFVVEPAILTQVLTTLLIGVLTALAFQLLLTCLGVAIGVSTFQIPSLTASSDSIERDPKQSSSQSGIGVWLGLGILLTFNLVLFVASFLATRFSQIHNPIEGVISGIVIWSAYFLLLLWLSSTAIGSLLGLVIRLTTTGFRRILSTIVAPFKADDEPVNSGQLVETVRQELHNALNDLDLDNILAEKIQHQLMATPLQLPQLKSGSEEPAIPVVQPAVKNFWNEITDYIGQTDAKKLTSRRLDRKLQNLLQDLREELPKDVVLQRFSPVSLEATLAQRRDLPDKKKQRINTQVETTWNTFIQNYPLGANGETNSGVVAPGNSESLPLKQTAQISKEILEVVSDQVFHHLPTIVQRLESNLPEWKLLAPLVMPIAREKVTDLIEAIGSDASFDSPPVKQIVQEVVQQPIEQAVETSQAGISVLNRTVTEQLEQFRDRATEQMEMLQRKAEEQASFLKLQVRERLEMTRKAAVAAMWWLFMTAFTGAVAAAFAGAIASGFNPLTLINAR